MMQAACSFFRRPSGLAALCIPLIILGGGLGARAQVVKGGRMRTEVNLVSVWVTVQDASGRPLAGLPREAFSVFDEGTQQQVAVFEAETQQPLDMALMIDTSLSAAKEMEFEGAAALRFIRKLVRPQDSLAVYTFAERVDRLTPYTSNPATLEGGLKRMLSGAGTSLYDAIYLASGELARRPPGRRRVIVLVTDAGETTSRATFEDARHAAVGAQALLYTIVIRAFRSDALRDLAGEHALATITDTTGGAMFIADDLNQLDRMFEEIDRELRMQYLLAFYPQPPPPKKSIRHLEVRVASAAAGDTALRVRNRRLYLTDGAVE
jgi:Ca-activated chloride channel family protein